MAHIPRMSHSYNNGSMREKIWQRCWAYILMRIMMTTLISVTGQKLARFFLPPFSCTTKMTGSLNSLLVLCE